MSRYIHAYFGNGKGKTTAAIGLAVRMAGAGGNVLFFQFLKSNDSSERNILQNIAGITVLSGMERVKFCREMSDVERKTASLFYERRLEEINQRADTFDMIVLDEFLVAVDKKIISMERAELFLKERPVDTEYILTGRIADQSILQFCDYVTEMKKCKHPYDRSIKARKGIEF